MSEILSEELLDGVIMEEGEEAVWKKPHMLTSPWHPDKVILHLCLLSILHL